MDLPSIDFALDVLHSDGDVLSDLSDAPSLIDDCDEPGDSLSASRVTSPLTPQFDSNMLCVGVTNNHGNSSYSDVVCGSSADIELNEAEAVVQTPTRLHQISQNNVASPLECLPGEVLQKVAIAVESDRYFCTLVSSSLALARKIVPENSSVWKSRFLNRYDYPMVDSPYEFCVAYKLRRMVLHWFIGFSQGLNGRNMMQLQVLRDMVLETYYSPHSHLPTPYESKNLQALSSPNNTSWVLKFFSCPFSAMEKHTYGRSNSSFEALQLVLSHLLLSPKLALVHGVKTSRNNYDLVKVYHYNQPFSTLYTRLTPEPIPAVPTSTRGNFIFPNLRSNTNSVDKTRPRMQYKLDTDALLHIRNFWHRHLIDDNEPNGEHTYAAMMQELAKLGKIPQQWNKHLQPELEISRKWIGHYSCVHPWPKEKTRLEECQTDAEDWDCVDPLTLEFVTTTDFAQAYWPPCFATIPAFKDTIPGVEITEEVETKLHEAAAAIMEKQHHTSKHPNLDEIENQQAGTIIGTDQPVFIRGIASFLDLAQATSRSSDEPSNPTTTSPTSNDRATTSTKYPPFTSLRVRGVIHDIPPSAFYNKADTTTPHSNKKQTSTSEFGSEQEDNFEPNQRKTPRSHHHQHEEKPKRKRNSRSTATTTSTTTRSSKKQKKKETELEFNKAMSIPGWKRIVMVMYKPTTRYLLDVLAYAEENYGGHFDTYSSAASSAGINTAEMWNDTTTFANGGVHVENAQSSQLQQLNSQVTAATTSSTPALSTSTDTIAPLTATTNQQLNLATPSQPGNIQTQIPDDNDNDNDTDSEDDDNDLTNLTTHLHHTTLPLLTLPQIHLAEDTHTPPQTLTFTDGYKIDYAYAYEGIIIPGGKIMMGRWWRVHGVLGLGDGREVGGDGLGVLVGDVDSDGNGGGDREGGDGIEDGDGMGAGGGSGSARNTGRGNTVKRELERGPFIFWST